MKNLKLNYIYNLFYQVILVLAPLITTPYVSRVLGAENIGTYSFAESILTYFKMAAALGMGIYGQRELSYCRDALEGRTKVFWETKLLEAITSAIAIVAYIVFALNKPNSTLYFVLLLGLLAGMFDISWFFYGMEEVGKIVLRNLIFKIVGIAYIFIFVKDSGDLLIYAFGNMFFMLVSNLSLWLFLPKYISWPKFNQLHPIKNIGVVIALFLPTATTQLFSAIDKTMIGLLTSDSFENGYYEQALKVERLALTIVTSVAVVLIPRVGYYFGKKNKEMVESYMYKGYRFVWMISIPLCFGLIGISKNLVPWFFGAGYEPVRPLLCMLSFLIIFMGINCISGSQYLIPTKREKACTIIVWAGSVINLGMNIVFIPKMYAMGASIASVLSEIVTFIIYFYVIRNDLSIRKIIIDSIKYWLVGIIMLVALLFASNYMAATPVNTLLLVAIGAIVYGSILLLFKDALVLETIELARGKIRSVIKK